MNIEEVAKKFNLETKTIRPVKSAILSKVYIIDGKYILRSRTLEVDTLKKFNSEQVLLKEVQKIIKIKFPSLLKIKSGKDCLIDGKFLWTAYPLIKGDPLCAWWNMEKLSEKEKKQIFKTLQKIHLKTEGKLGHISNNGHYDFIKDVTKRLFNAGSTITIKEYKRIQKAIKNVKSFKKGLKEKNICFIHGDYHPGNILLEKNKIVGLLDFDYTRKDFYLEDLSYTIMMFLRDYRKPFRFKENEYINILNWYGMKKSDIPLLNEYIILCTFCDFHLFRNLKQLPRLKVLIKYQRNFLSYVCKRFI